jgi:hypothetical protein
VSFLLLAPYIAVEAIPSLATTEHPDVSTLGIAVTASSVVLMLALGVGKRRLGRQLGAGATAIGQALASRHGVAEVHDLHVWEVTSEFPPLSAHVLVGRDENCHEIRRQLERSCMTASTSSTPRPRSIMKAASCSPSSNPSSADVRFRDAAARASSARAD